MPGIALTASWVPKVEYVLVHERTADSVEREAHSVNGKPTPSNGKPTP